MARSESTRSAQRLADADQDAGGEGDAELARQRDGPQPAAGTLSGRAIVRGPGASSRSESVSSMMPMLTLTSRSAAQIALAHEPGVGVGEEAGLLDHRDARGAKVAERGAMAVTLQEIAVLGEDGFRAVAEREERFFGAELLAALAERKHLVELQGAGARLRRDRGGTCSSRSSRGTAW